MLQRIALMLLATSAFSLPAAAQNARKMVPLRRLSRAIVLMVVVMVDLLGRTQAQSADPLAPYRAQREAYVERYRIEGRIEHDRLIPAARDLAALVENSSGETRARALLELGTIQRLTNDFTGAVTMLGRAAQAATSLGLHDVAFEAWIGVARAHEYGTSDHGAAAVALERAVDAAGEKPSAKQHADLADYRAQLEIGRGETEAGLIDALQAVSLATEPKDRFYAELDLADGLQKLAESCDYRPLKDAKSATDGSDTYGACRRAVAAARTAYERAAATASTLGWTHLVDEASGFIRRLELRRQLIDQRAHNAALNLATVFHPRASGDVLVSREFESGASTLTDTPLLAGLVDSVVAEADAQNPKPDARGTYLRGLAKDIRLAGPKASAQYFAAAAKLLAAERSSFFDLRHRGTVIENRGEIVRDLALRLLALRREADAFAAFESVRARGLGELASILARPDVTSDDRAWLADLLVLEARAGAVEHRIVGEIVATGRLDANAENLRQIEHLRTERRARLRASEAARSRFAGGEVAPPAGLDALRTAATRSGIPVLLYWTTLSNVVAWYVGPDGSDARSVFLPESVLEEKIGRVLASSGDSMGAKPFDEATARELFLFLVAPFAAELSPASVKQIMIVPQGPLVQLPFEALIDPASGTPVIDRWAISYAPNATMAIAALQTETHPVKTVAALVDLAIDDNTKETAAIQASGAQLQMTTRTELAAGSWQGDSLHLLLHGEFDPTEALLSQLKPPKSTDPPILAAEMLALPLRGLPLVVLSACKGGRVGSRISGEIYGFPWALLASGATATVLSRWDVNGDSNGRWMGVFYRELASGSSAAVAAATAMREMRKTGATHPYYWAAMQVNGR